MKQTAVKERPIIFKEEEVRATLEGRKTQFMSLVKPQPQRDAVGWYYEKVTASYIAGYGWGSNEPVNDKIISEQCPFGKLGERLWVKEAWQAWTGFNDTHASELPQDTKGRINYIANGNRWDAKLRSAQSMPRDTSRILLEITTIHMLRVQQISSEDAIALGVDVFGGFDFPDPVGALKEHWEKLHGPDSWQRNDWVWLIGFKRLSHV